MPHLFPLDDQPPGIAPARQLFDACAYRHLALSERDQVPFAPAIRARVLYVNTQKAVAEMVEDSLRRLTGAMGVQHVPDHPHSCAFEVGNKRAQNPGGDIAIM